jgi:hypothetical protein
LLPIPDPPLTELNVSVPAQCSDIVKYLEIWPRQSDGKTSPTKRVRHWRSAAGGSIARAGRLAQTCRTPDDMGAIESSVASQAVLPGLEHIKTMALA